MLFNYKIKCLSRAAVIGLSWLLVACGGGGGGGAASPVAPPPPPPVVTPDPAPGFSVSIDRTQLHFAGEEGGGIAPQVILGTGTGSAVPTTAYFGGEDLGTSIDRVEVRINGSQAQFTAYPKAQLPAGEYAGTLRLSMCADMQCKQHFKGSPVDVAYTISIAKGFKVMPGSVDLRALSGTSPSAQLAVQLPSGVTSFTATSSAPWLRVANTAVNTLTLSTAIKAPGSYTAYVYVSAANRQAVIPVNYLVTADPASVSSITPDRSSLDFTTPVGYASGEQLVKVSVPNWGQALAARVQYGSYESGWVTVTPGPANALRVATSGANLRPGAYRADLVLSAGPEVSTVTVPISLNVLAADWRVSGTSSFSVDAGSSAATLNGQIDIDVPNLPVQTWQASSSASWLLLSRSSGTLRSDKLGISVNIPEMLKLANNRSYSADVSLSLDSGKVAPTKFTVSLNKKLAQLNFISPHTRLPGEAGKYIVRGSGFDALADLTQALQVTGTTPLQIVRVNDTQMELNLPPAWGDVTLALNNKLGQQRGPVTLKALPQPVLSYSAVPTQGSKGSIVFDPERQAVFTVNKTLGSLMRFSLNSSGSGWTVSSVPVTGADAVAMAPDGSSLIVTVTSGLIKLFDPSTMSEQGSYKTDGVYGDSLNSLPRIAVRNDGKVLFNGFAISAAMSGAMPYFDLVSKSFGGMGGNYGFGWAVASGDGAQINIVQTASISPAPPMVTMDSRDETATVPPGGINFWYEAAFSLRGERFAEGTYTVWDRDFNKIGKVTLPDQNYFGRTPVFSPDGKRLYVMAYDSAGLYSSPTSKPRVYIFDSSTRVVTTTDLPLLGYFDLQDYPTCHSTAYECNSRAQGTISPDGKTLFFVGDTSLVVAPIPGIVGARAGFRQRLVLPATR